MSHTKSNQKKQLKLLRENALALFSASKNLTEYYQPNEIKTHLQIMFQRCMETSPEEYERMGAGFWQVFNFLDCLCVNPELITFIELFEAERYFKPL